MLVLVTGGAGYLGSVTCSALKRAGHDVRAVDNVMHGQHAVLQALLDDGVDVRTLDVRDADGRREAVAGADAIVHLAAIVGDPACAADPDLSEATNVDASRELFADAVEAGTSHFVFASTCSNYGVSRPGMVVDEESELNPASAYARQKVRVERELLGSRSDDIATVTCLRFATLYGSSPRMRFDLLVNEFVRDCWLDQTVDVYGGDTWRPYVHVRDAASAIAAIIDQRAGAGDRRVYNVGIDDDNYTKADVSDLVARRVGRGRIQHVATGPDPRTYRVSFDRLHTEIAPGMSWRVDSGIDDIVHNLDAEAFGDLTDPRFVNA